MIKNYSNIVCPYCKHEDRIMVELKANYPGSEWVFHRCDGEEGGCDTMMALHFQVEIDMDCHKISALDHDNQD